MTEHDTTVGGGELLADLAQAFGACLTLNAEAVNACGADHDSGQLGAIDGYMRPALEGGLPGAQAGVVAMVAIGLPPAVAVALKRGPAVSRVRRLHGGVGELLAALTPVAKRLIAEVPVERRPAVAAALALPRQRVLAYLTVGELSALRVELVVDAGAAGLVPILAVEAATLQ